MQKNSLQKIIYEAKNNRDLIMLLIIGGLYSLGIFLSNTFVNVYLWKQAGDYQTIAVYNLAIFIFQPLAFVFAGRLAKKVDRIFVLRTGVIFLSVFFLTVLLISEQLALYNFLLGSLLGVGYGFYWLAFDVLTFEITEPETRDFFNGFLGILQSLSGMIGPIAAGAIIAKMTDNVGYSVIFAVSFVLFIIAVVCSFFIKRRETDGFFYLKEVLLELKKNKNWRRIISAHVLQGLREGIFAFVITIWIYLVTKSEFSLGVFNLYFSGFSLVFYFIVIKMIKADKRKIAIFFGSILLNTSFIILLIKTSYMTLIVYGILIGIAYPIINVPFVSLTYDIIGKASYAKEMRIEYIITRELFANFGRIISISLFLFGISIFNPVYFIPILLLVFAICHMFTFIIIKDISLTTLSNE